MSGALIGHVAQTEPGERLLISITCEWTRLRGGVRIQRICTFSRAEEEVGEQPGDVSHLPGTRNSPETSVNWVVSEASLHDLIFFFFFFFANA